MDLTRHSGHAVRVGALADALAMIGERTPPWSAGIDGDAGAIRYYCATMEDGNASHWDEAFASEVWGGLVAPPGMLQSWIIPLAWTPDGVRDVPSLSLRVPLPGPYLINLSTDCEHFEPLRVGDQVFFEEELVAISDEKHTRVGHGHLVTTRMDFSNQHGALLARVTNVLLRYQKPAVRP